MVSFNKCSNAPASLAACRSYTGEDVVRQLVLDFKNKCYICGDKGPTTLNVEHFDEHRGDSIKMYDWFNLFYACGHCNAIKQYTFPKVPSNLLNCTDPVQKVDYWIEYRLGFDKKLRKKAVISKNTGALDARYATQTDNTVKLLDRVYNGIGTGVKDMEAENLLNKVNEEMMGFQKSLLAYKGEKDPICRRRLKTELEEMLSYESPFAAFKRWKVRDAGMAGELVFRNASSETGALICLH